MRKCVFWVNANTLQKHAYLIYRKFHLQKLKILRKKIPPIFFIFLLKTKIVGAR